MLDTELQEIKGRTCHNIESKNRLRNAMCYPQGCEVKNHIAFAHQFVHQCAIADIAFDQPQFSRRPGVFQIVDAAADHIVDGDHLGRFFGHQQFRRP